MKLKNWFWWIPLVIFIWVCWIFATLLLNSKQGLISTALEKPLPVFRLPALENPQQFYTDNDLRGKITVVNFWATWCPPCRDEHPTLVKIAAKYPIDIVGINYKDKPEAATKWLEEYGNPYTLTLEDAEGRVGIDWGVIGIPETFLVDAQGVVRYKHTGPITMRSWEKEIWPLICTWLHPQSNKDYIQCTIF